MKNFLILLAFISTNSFSQVKEKESNKILTVEDIKNETVEVIPDNTLDKNENSIYTVSNIEKQPDFPGGIDKFHLYSQKRIKISEEIKNQKIKGKVFVTFIVEKDGKLTHINVVRDLGYGTKEEVERLMKSSPNWIPAKLNGKTVRCHYSLPILIDGTK